MAVEPDLDFMEDAEVSSDLVWILSVRHGRCRFNKAEIIYRNQPQQQTAVRCECGFYFRPVAKGKVGGRS